MNLLFSLLTVATITLSVAMAAPDFRRMIPATLPPSATFRQPGWCLWDPCVIRDDQGTYHLYYSRWPTKFGFDAWCTHAEIAWATSHQPEGPYQFRGIALPSRGGGFWDGHSVLGPPGFLWAIEFSVSLGLVLRTKSPCQVGVGEGNGSGG